MKHTLNGTWQLYIPHINQTIPGTVPGSVYRDLLEAKIIPDPFYRTNEYEVREWMRYDYHYSTTFSYHPTHKHTDLILEGVDTLAIIYLNNRVVASTNNMHRSYRLSLDHLLVDGDNHLSIKIKSPIQYIEEKEKACPYRFYQQGDAIRGFIHLRKAHSNFGWDWGPQLPDAGIWRSVTLHSYDRAYIDHVQIKQVHKNHQAFLNYHIDLSQEEDVFVKLIDPDGKEIATSNKQSDIFEIEDPKLWWPVGYGKQPLYKIIVQTKDDEKVMRLGLKESYIKREPDQYGTSFTYVHNGIEIFLKGANYIIEDNVIGRQTFEVSKKHLDAAILANHNAIRIWGGGIYPSDAFYDYCDEKGLIVWQDFMFACAFYNLDDQELLTTIEHEIKDNAKRLYYHPSLMLFCGNNENETAAVHWFIPSLEVSKRMYLMLFEDLIPKWLDELDLGVFYWPSSPSSGGNFKDPNSDNMGDMHYWGVWHLNEPIEYYRKHFPRFMSEFGIQSFPAIETVRTYAEESDLHIYSKVMKSHQKNKTANSKIVHYMRHMFHYPKVFEHILYVSQLIQAEGVRYGVEHFRRHHGRTMGAIYWQLNDCWPVASWSSIDYQGRWKALHYHSKRFFAPILLSIEENKRKMTASIHLTNETRDPIDATLHYRLLTLKGEMLDEHQVKVKLDPVKAMKCVEMNYKIYKAMKKNMILHAKLMDHQGQLIAENTATFVQDKDLILEKADHKLTWSKDHNQVTLKIESPVVKRFVELKYQDHLFSDNYFHLLPHEPKIVTFESTNSLKDIKDTIAIRSLVDTYPEGV
jgi:beta-mannosidase